jgi:hypothetical protein
LQTEVEELKKTNAELENKVNVLEDQIKSLEYINGEFAAQEKKFKEKIEHLENRPPYQVPNVVISPRSGLSVGSISPGTSAAPIELLDENAGNISAEDFQSTTDAEDYENVEDYENAEDYKSTEHRLSPQEPRFRPVRDTKGKGKAVYESDPRKTREEMKILVKTLPEHYKLRVDEVFSSSENKKILARLIPELLRLMTPNFNPSRRQLHDWLGALHRHQRGRYIKSKTGKLEADDRRLHANSRLSEVRTLGLYIYITLHVLIFNE